MYMEFRPSGVVVKCKLGCPAVLVEHGHATAEYCDVTLRMREVNGLEGHHITAMCPKCRNWLVHQPLTRLERIYAEDVEQWIANAIRAGTPSFEATLMGDTLALRVPFGVDA